MELYLDCIRINTLQKTLGVPFGMNGLEIGAWHNPTGICPGLYFDGWMDEIRFWNISRTNFELCEFKNKCLTEMTQRPNGLYSYYPVIMAELFWSFPPTGDCGTILFDHSIPGGRHSEPLPNIGFMNGGAEGLTCCGGTKSCLCKDHGGSPNYDLSQPINLNDPNNCCWRLELNVHCPDGPGLFFVNRLLIELPVASIPIPTVPFRMDNYAGGWYRQWFGLSNIIP